MDIASFFSPSIFGNLVATILPFVFFLFFFFFSHFWQCHCHNWFPFWVLPLACILGTSRTRILVISLPKFNFLSSLTHCTFSCSFSNTVAEFQPLSLFCQITWNNTYNTNKLHFLQFLAKRLVLPVLMSCTH